MSTIERDLPGQQNELAGDELWSRQPIAMSDVADGVVTYRTIFGPHQCSREPLIDVTGSALTDERGRAELRLSDFRCSGSGSQAPVHVVATVRGDAPGFVTVQRREVGDDLDVAITFYAWAPDGSPLPGAAIDWRCRSVSAVIVYRESGR